FVLMAFFVGVIMIMFDYIVLLLQQSGFYITEILSLSLLSRTLISVESIFVILALSFIGYFEKLPDLDKMASNNIPFPENSKCKCHPEREAILRCADTGDPVCNIEVEIARFLSNIVPSRIELQLARILCHEVTKGEYNFSLNGNFVSTVRTIRPERDVSTFDIAVLVVIISLSFANFLPSYQWIFPTNFFIVLVLFLVLVFRALIQSRSNTFYTIISHSPSKEQIYEAFSLLWNKMPRVVTLSPPSSKMIALDAGEVFNAVLNQFGIQTNPRASLWKLGELWGNVVISAALSETLSRLFRQRITVVMSTVKVEKVEHGIILAFSRPIAGIKMIASKKIFPNLTIYGMTDMYKSRIDAK
ncbi:MAG: hypothetical protein QXL15_01520, partial [Candidatus Korarchaeota archaeon]